MSTPIHVVALRLGALLSFLLCIGMAACGGGGGAPDPGPNYPAAVDELSDTDLSGADVPALPQSASSSRASSNAADCESAVTLQASDAISLHNLISTADGFTTDVPPSNTSRIIGWALFELPAVAGGRLREISATIQQNPDLRLFYAVSNYSTGRWEYGGRIRQSEGLVDRTLSLGQQYNLNDGPGFLLVMVGHPGDASADGQSYVLKDVLVTSYQVDCLAEGFDSQTPGSINWGEGIVDYIDDDDINGLYTVRQDFSFATSQVSLLLPQSPDLFYADTTGAWPFQSIVGDWNGDGVDTVGFYDPHDVNGPRHSFRLSSNSGSGFESVQVSPFVPPPGGGPSNALIGLLIPALKSDPPLSGVTVELVDSSGATQRTAITNARGEFQLVDMDQLATESFSLNFEKLGLSNLPSYSIMLHSATHGPGPDYFSFGASNPT